jgi:CheY-like chemotaxis protein
MKVLIIEDDVVAQMGMRKIFPLFKKSIQFDIVENGKEGILCLENQGEDKVDIVILDLHTPVMNGFDFLQKIRSFEQFTDLPVIVHTTSNRIDDLITCRTFGISGYFVKHIDYEVYKENFLTILNYWFSSKQRKSLKLN